MDKVAYFKITRLKISRFKSHVEETEYHFGDLTMISGGNHTGKTTIADAIAWVMIGRAFSADICSTAFTTIRSGKSALL